MAWFEFFWTPEIERHLAEHGVSVEEFEHVVCFPGAREVSRSNPERMVAMGYDRTGRWLICVYEEIDDSTILPVTGFEPD